MKTLLFRLLIVTSIGASQISIAQTGTSLDPFTSIDQAANVSVAGFYFFNFSGTSTTTFVDENGFVQIALDFGTGIGDLPTTASLDTNNRGIFTPLLLSNLTGIKKVRISTSSNTTDVTTTNDSIISRIQNNTCLHEGYVDTVINNSWLGQNQDAFNTIPSFICGPYTIDDMLSQRIFHNCGAYDSFTWAQTDNYQREVWTDGEVSAAVRFQLWIKGNECSSPTTTDDIISSCIPITWIDGNTYTSSNNSATHSLTSFGGCDSIINLSLSINTIDITVTNNGSDLSANSIGMTYQWLDCEDSFNPISGETNQTYSPIQNGDFAVVISNNGCSDTSACQLIEGLGVRSNALSEITIYPNPAKNYLQIDSKAQIQEITILDLMGKAILHLNNEYGDLITININGINSGTYLLMIETKQGISAHKFTKL
jgi:hypothetical protein